MAVTEQTSNLKSLLETEGQLHEDVINFILNTLKCKSISDFANLFKESEYEDGVVSEILEKTSKKTDIIQKARLRTAWGLAFAQFQAAKARVRTAGPAEDEDLDKPLPKDVHEAQLKKAKDNKVPKFPPVFAPSDALFARCFREFLKRCFSVYSLAKVRSLEHQGTVMHKPRKTILAPGVTVSVGADGEQPGQNFTSVLEVLLALQILVNTWALTGTAWTQCSIDNKNEGYDGDYDEGLAYLAFCWDRSMAHPGPSADTVAWLLDRDRQTRTKARTLTADGCPWGKALRMCWETHLSVLWTVGGVGVSQSVPMAIADRAVLAEAQATVAAERYEDLQAQPSHHGQICPDWNSAHGCGKQKLCPHGAWHVCSFTLPDGTLCNSRDHNAVSHGMMLRKNLNVKDGHGRVHGVAPAQKGGSSSSKGGRGKGKQQQHQGKRQGSHSKGGNAKRQK